MLPRARPRWITAALVGVAVGLPASVAPSKSQWVDPPADAGAPPAPVAEAPAEVPQPPASPADAPPEVQPSAPAAAAPAEAQTPAAVPVEPDTAAPPVPRAPAVRSAQPEPQSAPERPAPAVQSAGRPGPPDQRTAARMSAARDLAVDYLNAWSAPNPEALASAPDFYAPRVVFHGRPMSIRDLMQEKRRFAQRWPERRYRPLPDTTGVVCQADGSSCTVRSVFEFAAANPKRGRRSQGIATLELVLSFVDDRPVITAESSLVHGRRRGERQLGLEGAPNG